MKEMILLLTILISFFLITVFLIVRLTTFLHSEEKSTPQNDLFIYQEIEENLLSSALDYYNENLDGEESVSISTEQLKRKGYVTKEELTPKDENNPCHGYVNISDDEMKAFIECDNYQTKGYKK